ncbi:MAG: cation transporter [Ignavibacteriae bacterium]|nr:cation transporter [Ignavibacteriota bacterium]
MAHTHSHNHSSGGIKYGKAFAIGIALNLIFIVVEVIYGLAANSSALLADAGHNASDVLSLFFAWGAAWIALKKPSGKYTYGLRRITILVSLLNAVLLLIAVALILVEAIEKIQNPSEIAGGTVMIVAGVGVIINGITAMMFMKGQKEDLNIKGAFLHMAADAGVSLGVVIAGLLIMLFNILWIDPMMSFVIVAVILYSTWGLLVDSLNLALDAVPKDIDVQKVRSYLDSVKGVEDVHDLHIWAMSTTQIALTAHLVVPEGYSDNFIVDIREELEKKFGIIHTTLQVEKSGANCDCC